MYCPRCGQQTISDVRFCSRCGMALHAVSEIVANNGLWPAQGSASKSKSPRKKGMSLGCKLMFISLAIAPLFLVLSFAMDGPEPLYPPVALFFLGLSWMLYARLFQDDVISTVPTQRFDQFRSAPPQSFALLPDRVPAVNSGPRRVSTAEIPQSPAVTEHTTQFFD